MEEENKLTSSYLDKIPVRNWIRKRLTSLWNYKKTGTPEQIDGGAIFFSKNSGLQNQSEVYMLSPNQAKPQVLLDPNKLSADSYITIPGYQPSPDGKYLAYELSQGGSDWETIRILDINSGKSLADSVRWVKFSNIVWTKDNKGFFYSRYPEPPKNKAISTKVINQKLYYRIFRLRTNRWTYLFINARICRAGLLRAM